MAQLTVTFTLRGPENDLQAARKAFQINPEAAIEDFLQLHNDDTVEVGDVEEVAA